MNYIYKKQLDKVCFAYDTVYVDIKNLARRTVSDNNFKEKADKFALNLQYDGYGIGLVIMVYKFYHKKIRSDVNVNEMLAQDLYKPVTKKFKGKKVY